MKTNGTEIIAVNSDLKCIPKPEPESGKCKKSLVQS